MSQSNIHYGTIANDGTGDPLRTAFISTQNNFIEIYSAFSFDKTTNNVTVANNISVPNLAVTAVYANGSVGSSGWFLTSNGSATYWSNPSYGSTTQVIFNDGGYSNGSSGFIYNKSTRSVTVNNAIVANTVNAASFNSGGLNISNTTGSYSNIVAANIYYMNTTLFANSVGLYANNVNATSYTVGSNFVANSSNVIGKSLTSTTNAATLGTALYSVSNGNIGISNASPIHKFSVNGNTFFGGPVTITNNVLLNANGGGGSAGQVLTSNGTGVYWATPSAPSFTANAQYTFGNTISFTNTVTFTSTSKINVNGSNGASQALMTNATSGLYWGNPVNTSYGYSFSNSLTTANGFYSTGKYGGTFTDGIVVDYVTGNGQIAVGAGDGINFYINRDTTPKLVMSANSAGAFNVATNTMAIGTSSIGGNGYCWLPNGLKMNWGSVSVGSSQVNVAYSSAHSAVPYNVQTTIYGNVAPSSGSTPTYVSVIQANATHISLKSSNTSTNFTVYWMTLGI